MISLILELVFLVMKLVRPHVHAISDLIMWLGCALAHNSFIFNYKELHLVLSH